jgi:hypothetical protein
MKKIGLLIVIVFSMASLHAQQVMSPELLWKLGRVSPIGISKDGTSLVYKVGYPSVTENKSSSKFYSMPIEGGKST